MKQKSLKKNAFFNILKTTSSLLFPLITFPYASRILLPEGTGKVNFANSVVSYFAMLASLGITTYATREAAKVRESKDKLSCLVKEIFIINLISMAIAYFLFFIALVFVPKFNEYRILLMVCGSSLLLATIGIEWLYAALEKYDYIAIRSIIFQTVSLALLFIFVKKKEDYINYAAISVFSFAGSNILNFINAHKYIDFRTKGKIRLKQHILPIFVLFGSQLAISVYTILDTSMLGFLSTNNEVGYYSVAAKINRMIRDLIPAAFSVIFARMSVYAAEKRQDEVLVLMRKTMHFICCLSFPMAVGLFILMKPIILVMCGEQYSPAIISGRILSPLIIISSIAGFLGGQILVPFGKEKTYLYSIGLGATIDAILNFILIRAYGSRGAATATIITEFIILIEFIFLTSDLLKKIAFKKQLLQYIFASTCMGIAIYFFQLVFPKNSIKLLITPIFGATVYAVLLFILKNEFIYAVLHNIKERYKIKL